MVNLVICLFGLAVLVFVFFGFECVVVGVVIVEFCKFVDFWGFPELVRFFGFGFLGVWPSFWLIAWENCGLVLIGLLGLVFVGFDLCVFGLGLGYWLLFPRCFVLVVLLVVGVFNVGVCFLVDWGFLFELRVGLYWLWRLFDLWLADLL